MASLKQNTPKNSRPRERLIEKGPSALSDSELIAIILGTGTQEEDVISLSNRILMDYPLDKISECGHNELREIPGIGPAKACQLAALIEISRRISVKEISGQKITTPFDIFSMYKPKLRDMKKETFMALLLDTRNRIIKEEIISIGTLNASIIHPREIFKPAIRESANSIILIHNHPSGDSRPSEEDKETTRRIVEAGNLLGIPVADHVIIGNNFFSFALEKLI